MTYRCCESRQLEYRKTHTLHILNRAGLLYICHKMPTLTLLMSLNILRKELMKHETPVCSLLFLNDKKLHIQLKVYFQLYWMIYTGLHMEQGCLIPRCQKCIVSNWIFWMLSILWHINQKNSYCASRFKQQRESCGLGQLSCFKVWKPQSEVQKFMKPYSEAKQLKQSL